MSRPMRRRIEGKALVRPKRDTPRRRTAPRFDTAQWDEASMLLAARCRMLCEICGDERPTERHHRQRRRDGGDRLANLLFLCTECHRRITDRPESETQARELGYIVRALGLAQPEDLPVFQWGSTWVLLDDLGHAMATDPPTR